MTEKYLWWEYTNSFLESSSEGPKDARENVVFVTLQKVFFGADKSPKGRMLYLYHLARRTRRLVEKHAMPST